jgi:hypothetical protein
VPYINPEQYAATSAYDLLEAAAHGFIAFDQRLVHALVDDPARTLSDIVRFALRPDFEAEFEPDFIAIFRHLNTPEAVPFYIAAIRRGIEEIPDDVTEAVVALGAPTLEPMLELYEEVGEEDGGGIAFMLAGLGMRDQRIFELLLERLEYEAGDGALSLSLYGDPAAIPHIKRVLLDVAEHDDLLRHELQNAIAQIEASQIQSPVPPEPFDVFELFPDEAGPAFGMLSEADRLAIATSDAPPEIRAEAVGSFRSEKLPRPIRDRISQISKLDPDPNVRGRAWESLSDSANEPEIRRSMLEAARNAPLEERTGAVVGLASGPEPDEEALPLIEALYEEPSARAKALEAMWKSLNPGFKKHMVDHLDDPDPLVRHHAIYGIGYLGVGSEAPRLVELFDDEDFRHDALLAYSLSVPAEISRSRVKPLFRRIEQLAGGLSEPESELVEEALDQRLALNGLNPVFDVDAEPVSEPEAAPKRKVGRNDPCPCGSGKKYKKCHGA